MYVYPKHSMIMTYMLRENKRDVDNIIKQLTVNTDFEIYLCFYSYLNMADMTGDHHSSISGGYKVDILTRASGRCK